MNIVFARNDHPGIMIICPHCKFGARHEAGAIEDAIHDHKEIECVSCGETFRIMVFIGGVDWASDDLIEQTATSGKTMSFDEMCEKAIELAKSHDKICYLYEMPNGQLLACLSYLNKNWLFKSYPGGRNELSSKGQSYGKTNLN